MVVKGREIERSRSFAQCMAQLCTAAEKPPMSLWHGPMWNSQPVPRMNPRPMVSHGAMRIMGSIAVLFKESIFQQHQVRRCLQRLTKCLHGHIMSFQMSPVAINHWAHWCELIANVLRISTAFGRIFLRIPTPLFLLPSGKRSHITNWKITMHFVNG